ncbi:OmpA family protein [Brachybacterium sp. FME24]|uniref:OmpA family protein n=1 Tax=Brachybacterium sp. FME24 TaxID=2742605 RepID=UPI001868F850|nr:OmpA family protein [Brachybacterium sp. FME24]
MRRRTLVSGMLAVTMLAACDAQEGGVGSDGGDPGGGGASDGGASDGGGAAAAPVQQAVAVTYGPLELQASVVSVVRSGEHLVLTLDVTADDPDEDLRFGPVDALSHGSSSDNVDAREYDALRLLDLSGDRCAVVAMDTEGRSVVTEPAARWRDRDQPEGTERVQLVYGDLGTDEVTVLIPKGGLLAPVPVTDDDVPDARAEEPLDLGAVASAPVNPLIAFSTDLTSTTRTESTPDSTIVSLGADVLFDSSSAELTADSQGVIEEAAQTLSEHEPGPVRVVGHTDSVDEDAFNQDLSERRAQAVADILGTLIDGADYPTEVSGKGETEPIADNDTDEGRTLNRRVELSIDTPVVTQGTVTRELPETEGPVATGEQGVSVGDPTPVEVRAPSARLVQDHLVVHLEITRLDEAVDNAIGITDFSGGVAMPDGVVRIKSNAGIAVMDGPVATLPAMHHVGDEESAIRALTDLRTNSRFDGGATRVDELIYPACLTVGETITIQLAPSGWRLTDIPVER